MLSRKLLRRSRLAKVNHQIKRKQHNNPASKVQPYTNIPKVKGLPIIGSLNDYIQHEGGILQLHKLYNQRLKEYGPIYREKIPFKNEMLVTSNPSDIEKVFKDEQTGKMSKRNKALWAFPTFTKKHGMPDPLFEMNDKDFTRRKESIKKAILQPKQVAKLTEMYDIASKDFLSYIEMMRDLNTNTVDDIIKGLYLWGFECGGITVFRKHLGVLKEKEITDPSVKALFEIHEGLFKEMYELEAGGIHHRLQYTKLWKSFEKRNMVLYSGTKELLDKYPEFVIDKDANLSYEEKLSTIITIFNAAIATTAETALWSFIELSANPKVQDKLYEEITQVVGNSTIIDNSLVQQMPYLRACLKECFRKRPLFLLNSRLTQSNLVLSGYEVPANTNVLMLTGFNEKTHPVEENTLFKPERWMKNSGCPISEKPHPFAVLPFGHGIRACMGRRLAENELYTLFANVFKNYKISIVNESFETEYYFSHVIKDPITIKLENR